MNFYVKAIDYCAIQQTANLNITLTNINDNIPKFERDFYDFEISTNARIGTHFGDVRATDDDVEGNGIKYDMLYQMNGFEIDSAGKLTTTETPYLPYHKYVRYVTAKDNDSIAPMTSLISTLRIDTYVECDVLTRWRTNVTRDFFTEYEIKQFINSVSNLCSPCTARLHNVTAETSSSGLASVNLYMLRDNTTRFHGNLGRPKDFLSAETIIKRIKNVTSINNVALRDVTESCLPVVVPFNWWLQTVLGNALIGIFLSILLTLWLSTIIALAIKFCSGTRTGNRIETPFLRDTDIHSKPAERDSHKATTTRVTEDLNILDFRYGRHTYLD
ncbi:uncharacterized protein LOC141915351 [Tubulanus polymorphus]|uniref:uncharacterized protein LOC141915351 n=1 Tax=Tubulanus polymorphus TaxID=672921 RepID=UPI003DA4E969